MLWSRGNIAGAPCTGWAAAMTEAWGNFFTVQVGGAAALLGPPFVGLSINQAEILKSLSLANRALLALVLLLIAMIQSLVFLIPDLGARALSAVVSMIGLATLVGGTPIEISLVKGELTAKAAYPWDFLLFEISCLPYAVAGALLYLGNCDALHWAVAGMILSIIKAALDAWVLLVEVNQ